MSLALRTLLTGVIDYAGLFPPARLPLDRAVDNFAEYRRHPDAWMLRHFVISAQQLSELTEHFDKLSDGANRWTLSVVGQRCRTRHEWNAVLENDLSKISEFAERHRSLATVATLELPLPEELGAIELSQLTVDEVFGILADATEQHALFPETVFLELPAGAAARESHRMLTRRIGQRDAKSIRFGFKLRMGGLEPAAIPSIEQTAETIHLCQQDGVTWKATAGLHHPLPRHSAEIGATMHGFLNLLVAVTMAESSQLHRSTLEQILAETSGDNFVLTDDGLSWRDHHATIPEIEAARERFVSFGSCSFDEPRADLGEMGYDLDGCHSTSR